MIITKIPSSLIAPCGMNCGICRSFLRKNDKCVSCNVKQAKKPKHCLICSIKSCNKRSSYLFCYNCNKYPCRRLKQLDSRYRTKYGMSTIDNLNKIKKIGLEEFMKEENTRWACQKCGKPICVHNNKCYSCGKQYEKN